MLSIYVRHTKRCLEGDPQKGIPGLRSLGLSREDERAYRKCQCPKWYSGALDGKGHPRASLDAPTWKAAEAALEKLSKGEKRTGDSVSVQDALNAWIEEVLLSQLAPGTTRQYELLRKRLLKF